MEIVPLILLFPLLAAVAYFDIRYLRIPNSLVITAIILFAVTAPLIGWPEAGWRLLAGVVVFCVGLITFIFRWFGGGDVKMLAALFLFVPSQTYTIFGFVFSAAMLLGIALILMLRAAPMTNRLSLKGIQEKGGFPMGISIAGAGIAHPFILNSLF